jgi:hypothetical protein
LTAGEENIARAFALLAPEAAYEEFRALRDARSRDTTSIEESASQLGSPEVDSVPTPISETQEPLPLLEGSHVWDGATESLITSTGSIFERQETLSPMEDATLTVGAATVFPGFSSGTIPTAIDDASAARSSVEGANTMGLTNDEVTLTPKMRVHTPNSLGISAPARGQAMFCGWVDYPFTYDIHCSDTGVYCEYVGGECWECSDGCTLEAVEWNGEYVDLETTSCECEEGYVWNEWTEECEESEGGGGGGGEPPPPPPTPSFDCDESSVVRGDELSCTLDITGAQLTDIRWRYISEETFWQDLDSVTRTAVTGPVQSSTWAGTIAAPGTVRVTAVQNGNIVGPFEADISVTSRAANSIGWIDSVLVVDTTYSVPGPVATGEDLGYTETFFEYVGVPWTVIGDDGPNHGWLLPTDFSQARQRHVVHINAGQTKTTGELYSRHNNPVEPFSPATAQNKCPAGVIISIASSGLRNRLNTHEGTNWDAGSHTGTRRATLAAEQTDAQSWFEALVVEDPIGSANDLFFAVLNFSVEWWVQEDGVDPWLPQLTDNCRLIRVTY